MNDVRVITDKIISDAQALAADRIRSARERAELVYAQYEERAEELRDNFQRESEAERADALYRADNTVKNALRAASLSAKGRALASVYDKVRERILSMESDEYLELMSSMLKRVLAEVIAEERILLAKDVYGEIEVCREYVLMLSARDAAIGEPLLELSEKCLEGEEKTLTVTCSDKVRDGGFILAAKDISIDCSLSSLLPVIRKETEQEVLSLLFDESERG